MGCGITIPGIGLAACFFIAVAPVHTFGHYHALAGSFSISRILGVVTVLQQHTTLFRFGRSNSNTYWSKSTTQALLRRIRPTLSVSLVGAMLLCKSR